MNQNKSMILCLIWSALCLNLAWACGGEENRIYPLTVGNESRQRVIQAYDWVAEDITVENFPPVINQPIEMRLKIFQLKQEEEADDAELLQQVTDLNSRLANLDELLAFGAEYPEALSSQRLLALASAWRNTGSWWAPCGYTYGDFRFVGLCWMPPKYTAAHRFLTVQTN